MPTGLTLIDSSGSREHQRIHNMHKILGIGTPVIDYFLFVTEDFIQEFAGKRGGSAIVDHRSFTRILAQTSDQPICITGGSSANTLKGLARLGHNCTIIGRIGNDPAADRFEETIEAHGITPHLTRSNKPTAQSACLLSPCGDRTMRTFLGAGADLIPSDLHPDQFKGVDIVHIEGYLLANPPVVKRAMELAKEAGAVISFDLSSFEIIEQFRKPVIDTLSSYVNIVFANADETKLLTNLSPEKGCVILKDLSETAIVKVGAEGCWAAQGIDKVFCPAIPVNVVDTTGAGDLFASGFLHGMMQSKPLMECTRYGTLVASNVIQVIGAEIPPTTWDLIKKSM